MFYLGVLFAFHVISSPILVVAFQVSQGRLMARVARISSRLSATEQGLTSNSSLHSKPPKSRQSSRPAVTILKAQRSVGTALLRWASARVTEEKSLYPAPGSSMSSCKRAFLDQGSEGTQARQHCYSDRGMLHLVPCPLPAAGKPGKDGFLNERNQQQGAAEP